MLPLNYSPVANSCEFNYAAWLLGFLHISSKADWPVTVTVPHFYKERGILGRTWVESAPANERLIQGLRQPSDCCSLPLTWGCSGISGDWLSCCFLCPALPSSRPQRSGMGDFPQLPGETDIPPQVDPTWDKGGISPQTPWVSLLGGLRATEPPENIEPCW